MLPKNFEESQKSSAADDQANDLIRQFNYLRGMRGNWENQWTEIAKRIYPMDSNLFQTFQTISSQGDKRNQELLDSTGLLALQRFGAILDSLLTPRNQFWHQLIPNDKILMRDKATMDWFSQATTILFQQRYAPTANFASQNQRHFKGLGGYGTAGMFIDDLMGQKGFRYKDVHLSELFLQENHQGIIDRVCRNFSMTARQAVQKFGDACPEVLKTRAKDAPEAPSFFLHWVYPRENRDSERRDYKGMEYASCYVSIDGAKLLSEGGYRVFPFAVSRYEQATQETYGRSPAMDALPALKTLNKEKEIILKQGQLAVDPVLLVHDDGIMDGASVESGTYISGAISAAGNPLIQPLPAGRVDIGKELMDDERNLINDTFLVSLFQILVDTPEMTAAEVIERTREKGILLAPTIGRQQSEYLGPLINREIDLAGAQGLLPPMPAMLKDAEGEYEVMYDSPITRTQKADWASGAVRTIQLLQELSVQTQDPSKLAYINWDVAIPQIAEIYGTPSTWLNSKDQVQAEKQALAQRQQMQTAIQAAPAVAGMVKASK